MISSSTAAGVVGSESSTHSKHRFALRLFYSLIVFIVGAALLPVIPAAAVALPGPQVASAPSAYTGVNPTRVMDTRAGSGYVGAGNTLGPGASFSLVVAPNATAGVPANATAVVMNVTVTNTTAASYLTVYPTLNSLPFASNLNWVAGYTVPNLVTVQPGSGGAVTFYNKFGSTDVIADIAGYYAPPTTSAGGEVATGFPQRLVDTRAGSGKQGAGSALGPAATATYQVTGNAGVPATGVSAVIVNATVTNTTAPSFLTLWAGAPATRNTVSNANWVAGWTRANRAIVPVSATGKISVYNQFGSVDVVLDVNGYFTDATATGQLFTSLSPIRLADHTALGPNSSFNLSVGGVAGVPAGASAAIFDVVTSETTAPSFLTVAPSPGAGAATSDINWVAGQVNPNLTVTTLGTGGQANFYNSAGDANVSVDLEGYFGSGGGVSSLTVTATPSSVPADNTTTSSVTATVTKNGSPVSGDAVSFSKSASVTGSCGALSATSGVTNSLGQVTITYTASTTVGTCTITATDANNSFTGSAVITQTTPPNAISVAPAGPINKAADGASTQTFTANVLDPNGVAVSGDTVNWTASGTCGTVSPASTTTNSSGNATSVYITSTTSGFCKVTATETGTGQSASQWITQTSSPVPANVPYHVAAVTCTASVPADKTTTTTCSTTVKDNQLVQQPVNNDPVLFTKGAGCKDVLFNGGSSAVVNTNSLGQASFTYTAGSVAGTCTINAYEANDGQSNTAGTELQTAVPNTVTVTATPSTIPNNGTSSSTVVATVTSPGGVAVSGDSVTFAGAPTPGGACGSGIPAGALVTNSSGQVAFGYVSSTTAGFCKITATDNGTGAPAGTGGSGNATITQTSTSGNTITASANPTSVPADNATQSTISATVRNSAGTLVSGDIVSYSKSASVTGACGALTSPTVGTNANGVATNTYTASTTAGTCTITLTEANGGASATVAITQTAPPNSVVVTPAAAAVAANGSTPATFTANVTTFGGVSIVGDTVTFTVSGSPSAACGTMNPVTATTNSSGNATSVYISSSTSGFCTITAADNGTGTPAGPAGSGTAVADQTTSPAPGNQPYTVQPVSCTATVPADGTTTTTCHTTVANSVPTPVSGDPVMFTKAAGANCKGVKLNGASSTVSTTNASGVASFTYTAGSAAAACTLIAQEANTGVVNNTGSETQTPVPDTVAASASPSSIAANGTSTSTITILVTDANGVPVSAQVVNLVGAPTPAGACGSFPASATTTASGQATVVYVSSSTAGFCTITVTEAAPKTASATVQVTQHP